MSASHLLKCLVAAKEPGTTSASVMTFPALTSRIAATL